MFPDSGQFGGNSSNNPIPPFKLNKKVRRIYPQLAEQLTLQIRQKRLEEYLHFPWNSRT